jgi:hypothetical protein
VLRVQPAAVREGHQAGSFANTLATNRDYFCRMVGSTFQPCGTSYGGGAGYPVNFWLANPFALGSWTGASYMSDKGYSNYNGLQIDFRQRPWHGLSGNANYNPTFAQSTTALSSTGFGRGTQTATSHRIELRGNIEF